MKEKEELITRTYWSFWWVRGLQTKPSYFLRGIIMIGTILLFPIWSPVYLLYLIVEGIGTLNGKPKKYEVLEEALEERGGEDYYN